MRGYHSVRDRTTTMYVHYLSGHRSKKSGRMRKALADLMMCIVG
jgi:hypothetical protein